MFRLDLRPSTEGPFRPAFGLHGAAEHSVSMALKNVWFPWCQVAHKKQGRWGSVLQGLNIRRNGGRGICIENHVMSAPKLFSYSANTPTGV